MVYTKQQLQGTMLSLQAFAGSALLQRDIHNTRKDIEKLQHVQAACLVVKGNKLAVDSGDFVRVPSCDVHGRH